MVLLLAACRPDSVELPADPWPPDTTEPAPLTGDTAGTTCEDVPVFAGTCLEKTPSGCPFPGSPEDGRNPSCLMYTPLEARCTELAVTEGCPSFVEALTVSGWLPGTGPTTAEAANCPQPSGGAYDLYTWYDSHPDGTTYSYWWWFSAEGELLGIVDTYYSIYGGSEWCCEDVVVGARVYSSFFGYENMPTCHGEAVTQYTPADFVLDTAAE